MQSVIVVRCLNGPVAWVRVPTKVHMAVWVCARDQFKIDAPADPQHVEAVLTQMAQHSVQLAGALQQIVQLAL